MFGMCWRRQQAIRNAPRNCLASLARRFTVGSPVDVDSWNLPMISPQKGAAEGHQTFRIQHRRGAAVLLSEDDCEGLLETVELLSQPRFR